jgi:hypothetical protein
VRRQANSLIERLHLKHDVSGFTPLDHIIRRAIQKGRMPNDDIDSFDAEMIDRTIDFDAKLFKTIDQQINHIVEDSAMFIYDGMNNIDIRQRHGKEVRISTVRIKLQMPIHGVNDRA